ncbi:MAG: DUF4350 domain-containing protein [Pirellula sp.]|nr:DUF4350 domain-containing protein [Pirellula sp.]
MRDIQELIGIIFSFKPVPSPPVTGFKALPLPQAIGTNIRNRVYRIPQAGQDKPAGFLVALGSYFGARQSLGSSAFPGRARERELNTQATSEKCLNFAAFLLFAMCGMVGRASFAQEPSLVPTDPEWHFRYELFQSLLEKRGLKVSTVLNEALTKPEESVVVLLGDLQKVSSVTWSNLRGFLLRGGNLLIATDRTPLALGMRILEIGTVNAGPLLSSVQEDCYEGFSDCLRVRNLDASHPITKGLDEIVTNRSGWLSRPISSRSELSKWLVIASLPEDSQPNGNTRGRTFVRSKPLIAVFRDATPRSGTAILAADASLFTNGMLWHADNGLLSIRIADAMSNMNRNRLVYLVDGVALPSLQRDLENKSKSEEAASKTPSQVPANQPTPESLLRFANLAIKRVAESNIVNEALRNQPRNVSPTSYFRWIWGMLAAVLISLLVLLWMRRRAGMLPFLSPRRMRSWHELQTNSIHPLDQNSFAAECLARDFCRKWIGKDFVPDWQLYLQDLDLESRPVAMSKQERATVRTIVELAVYGKKSMFSDEQLQNLGVATNHLLLKLSTD